MSFEYRNDSDHTLVIVNHGEVAPGKIIATDEELNHPSLRLVKGRKPADSDSRKESK